MEKVLLIRFLRDRHRGIYATLVAEYSSIVNSCHVSILKRAIEIDLEKYTDGAVQLNYFSLAKAVKKFKKNTRCEVRKEKPVLDKDYYSHEFKDAYELDEAGSVKPGSFKL